jgi:hypothetical protein
MKKKLCFDSSDSSSSKDQEGGEHITTQLLEQILLSSQEEPDQRSTFTQKYKTRTQLASVDSRDNLQNQGYTLQLGGVREDQGSTGVITVQTHRSVIPMQTGGAKNWRHLITPAHDSFKKLENQRRPGEQYSQHHPNQ